MRILITGGAGCLGSNIIEALLPAGHEILVIDNFATGKREVVPAVDGLQVIEGSVADTQLVEDAFTNFAPTHVIHSAAAYKDPQNWLEDTDTNVRGTANVVMSADKHDVKRLVYFQTALCYGRPETVPIPVTHPLRPITSYGISKTAGESIVAMGKTPWISFRLANVTGPRLAIGPIPTFYKRLKAGQSCFCSDTVRDFVDMQDFMSLLGICLDDTATTGVFNVSTGIGHSIREVYEAVAAYLRIDPPHAPTVPCGDDDVPAVVLDPSLTEKTFGWNADKSFTNLITKMLQWYDKYGVTDIYSHLSSPAKIN